MVPISQANPQPMSYIDDENVYLAVYPNVTSGGWINVDFRVKKFSGEIDFAFGYDSDISYPTRAQVYSPRNTTEIQNYTVPEKYFSDPNFKANYTFSSQNSTHLVDGRLYLWRYNGSSWEIQFGGGHDFDYAEKASKTMFWEVEIFQEWIEVSSKKWDWEKISFDYLDMDRWYVVKGLSVIANKNYTMRVWLDVLPQLDGSMAKYCFAIKRSSDSFHDARKNGRLYVLDPWYNTDWEYRKSHVITNATGAGAGYQINLTVHYGSGSDSGNDVYLDGNCETDFDDLRFTDDDGETLLDYWNETKVDSSQAFIWVEVQDDLSSENQTIYIYYGNSGASSISNGKTTFPILFDDFPGSSLDLTVWTVDIAEPGSSVTIANSIARVQGGPGKNKYTFSSKAPYTTDDPASLRFYSLFEIATANDQIVQQGWGMWGVDGWTMFRTYRGLDESILSADSDGNPWTSEDIGPAYFGDWKTYDTHRNLDTEFYVDGVQVDSIVHDWDPDANTIGAQLYCRDEEFDLYCDWVLIREYVDPEPGHGAWGSEEEAPGEWGHYWLILIVLSIFILTIYMMMVGRKRR